MSLELKPLTIINKTKKHPHPEAIFYCPKLIEDAEEAYLNDSFPFYSERLGTIIEEAKSRNKMHLTGGQKICLEEITDFYRKLKTMNEKFDSTFHDDIVSLLEKILKNTGEKQIPKPSADLKKYGNDTRKAIKKIKSGVYFFPRYLDPAKRTIQQAKKSKQLSDADKRELDKLQGEVERIYKKAEIKIPKSILKDHYPRRLFFPGRIRGQ